MDERPPIVLIAMPPTETRRRVVRALSTRDLDVRTGDDAVNAVDRIREADAVLVGGFPERIRDVVLEASTPPGVSRPTVLLETQVSESNTAPDEVPSVPANANVERVVDAVERAVKRREYASRVRTFSAVAAEAASCEHESGQLGQRVASLSADARRAQRDFSPADWTATFRTI